MEENEEDIQFDFKLPEDTHIIKQIGPWRFSLSKLQNSLFIEVTDYHAGPLKLSKANLNELLEFVEQKEECMFYDAAEGENKISENDYAYAILYTNPVFKGHTLIIPKRHFKDYLDITKEEYIAIHDLIRTRRQQLLEEDSTIQGFSIVVNLDQAGGQAQRHCHVHLIPERTGDAENP